MKKYVQDVYECRERQYSAMLDVIAWVQFQYGRESTVDKRLRNTIGELALFLRTKGVSADLALRRRDRKYWLGYSMVIKGKVTSYLAAKDVMASATLRLVAADRRIAMDLMDKVIRAFIEHSQICDVLTRVLASANMQLDRPGRTPRHMWPACRDAVAESLEILMSRVAEYRRLFLDLDTAMMEFNAVGRQFREWRSLVVKYVVHASSPLAMDSITGIAYHYVAYTRSYSGNRFLRPLTSIKTAAGNPASGKVTSSAVRALGQGRFYAEYKKKRDAIEGSINSWHTLREDFRHIEEMICSTNKK